MKKEKSKVGIGAAILLISGVVCKALGALFRLPLTNLLGIEGIGVFQLVMSLYAFALVLTSGGVTNALSKLISSARARGEMGKVGVYLRRALFVSIGSGFLIGVFFLIFGKFIAAFQGIDATFSYMLFLLLLPLGAGLACFRGFFQGYENMVPTAVSQIIEQIFKFVLGLLLAYFFSRFGMAEGVFGAFLGIVCSELVSLIFLFALFFRRSGDLKRMKDLQGLRKTRAEFNSANFPLLLSASILPLTGAFDGLVIVPRLMMAGFDSSAATSLYGLQTGIVGAILNFPLIISMAVTTTLLPSISYRVSRGSGGKVVIERALLTLFFLILPTTFGMIAISRPVLLLFYKNMTSSMLDVAFNLMLFGGFSIVFTALMQFLVMLLQANGQFKFILAITALGGVAKAILSFFLSAVPSVNIFALVLGNIVLAAIVCVLALWRLKKISAFSLRFADLFIVMLSALLMFLAVYSFCRGNRFSVVVNLLISICIGGAVYLVLSVPVWKTLLTHRLDD